MPERNLEYRKGHLERFTAIDLQKTAAYVLNLGNDAEITRLVKTQNLLRKNGIVSLSRDGGTKVKGFFFSEEQLELLKNLEGNLTYTIPSYQNPSFLVPNKNIYDSNIGCLPLIEASRLNCDESCRNDWCLQTEPITTENGRVAISQQVAQNQIPQRFFHPINYAELVSVRVKNPTVVKMDVNGYTNELAGSTPAKQRALAIQIAQGMQMLENYILEENEEIVVGEQAGDCIYAYVKSEQLHTLSKAIARSVESTGLSLKSTGFELTQAELVFDNDGLLMATPHISEVRWNRKEQEHKLNSYPSDSILI